MSDLLTTASATISRLSSPTKEREELLIHSKKLKKIVLLKSNINSIHHNFSNWLHDWLRDEQPLLEVSKTLWSAHVENNVLDVLSVIVDSGNDYEVSLAQ